MTTSSMAQPGAEAAQVYGSGFGGGREPAHHVRALRNRDSTASGNAANVCGVELL